MSLPTNLRVPLPKYPPYFLQSIAVEGTKRPGQTAHYRNALYGLIDENTPNVVNTLDKIFQIGLAQSRDLPCLGTRPVVSTNPLKYADHYVWQTYREVDIRRRRIGSALVAMFNSGKVGGGDLETVGIWSPNRPEWQIIDLALHSYAKVGVSLYDTLGKNSVEYIINHAELSIVFATADHIPSLLKIASKVPILKVIVSIDPLSPRAKHDLSKWAAAENIELKEFSELEAFGAANPLEPIPATPQAIVSICYTSGTTGNPKGVLFTHYNVAITTCGSTFGDILPEEDVCLISYLPLAHVIERMLELMMFALGGRIGYSTGDPLRLLEDAQVLKPHLFPTVPRILNRIYHAAMAGANLPGQEGATFREALRVKREQFRETGITKHPHWDKLVFSKVQAILGGNVKAIGSGSAPVRQEVIEFFQFAFDSVVYGMTEGCGSCTRTWPYDKSSSGTVGAPYAVAEVKLVDVPEMGYTSEDKPFPRGEICMRGAHCFPGYYKDPEKTAEAIDADGWVHTGDVGTMDECARFKIIDRVKNIMKLAQGEYVALEKVENLYGSSSPMVAQVYVHGDSLQPYLLGVVVPERAVFSTVASKLIGKKITPQDVRELEAACVDERVIQHVLGEITDFARANGLAGFEMVKRIHLSLDPFSTEDGTLTPTMKIRRKHAYLKHKLELDALYALGEPTSRPSKL